MNAMLSDLKKNSENGAIAIGKTKVAIYDANGEMRNMGDVYSDLEKSTQGMSDAQRDMALMNVFGEQSMRAVNTVLGQGSDKFDDLSKSIKDSNGYAAEMEEIMTDNLKGDIDGLSSAWEGFKIALFDGGMGNFARPIVQGLTNIIQKLPKFVEGISKSFRAFKDFATGGGSLITKFKDVFSQRIDQFRPIFEKLRETSQTMMAKFGEVFSEVWSIVSPILGALISVLSSVSKTIIDMIVNTAIPYFERFAEIVGMAWSIIKPVLEFLASAIVVTFETLRIVWDTIIDPFIGFLTGAFASAIELTSGVVDGLSSGFQWLGDKISWASDKFNQFKDWISGFKPPEWLSSIGDTVAGVGGKVKGFFGGGTDGSHADGAYSIPFNGYRAELHKGESVLTANQSNQLRSMGMLQEAGGGRPKLNLPNVSSGGRTSNQNSFSLGSISINVGGSNASATDIEKAVQRGINKAINEAAAVLGN